MANIQNPLPPQSDPLQNLPIDQSQPTHKEIELVDTLFKEHRGTMSMIADELKSSVIVGALFLILSLPQIDALFRRMIPSLANSTYIMLIIKVVIFVGLYWILKHFYLCRLKK